MSEDYKVQVSLKFGPGLAGMLNIRADSVPELEGLIEAAEPLVAGKIAGLTEAIGPLAAIGAAFPGTTVVSNTPATSGAPVCNHGAMVYRSGGSGNDRWEGHFCSQPKGAPDKCKPIYPRK